MLLDIVSRKYWGVVMGHRISYSRGQVLDRVVFEIGVRDGLGDEGGGWL